jgi:hypothetical protein
MISSDGLRVTHHSRKGILRVAPPPPAGPTMPRRCLMQTLHSPQHRLRPHPPLRCRRTSGPLVRPTSANLSPPPSQFHSHPSHLAAAHGHPTSRYGGTWPYTAPGRASPPTSTSAQMRGLACASPGVPGPASACLGVHGRAWACLSPPAPASACLGVLGRASSRLGVLGARGNEGMGQGTADGTPKVTGDNNAKAEWSRSLPE